MHSHHEVLWDTGATLSVSNDRNDFVTDIHPLQQNNIMKGLQHGIKIEGIGEVVYYVYDVDGIEFCLQSPAYYIPTAT
jgi:hypothetical protein